jgi:hypothetical protein
MGCLPGDCDRGGQSLLRVAVSVGTVTSLCKVVGMAREMLLAAHFGVGPVRSVPRSTHYPHRALVSIVALRCCSFQVSLDYTYTWVLVCRR